jgi:single-stranded DNA-binding protein
MTNTEPTITLFGNVGKDPEVRLIPGRDIVKKIYDPIVRSLVIGDSAHAAVCH